MSVTSPTSASPSLSLMEWDEAAVQSYLSHIGLPQYEDVILEHGITGDVLAIMDHESLQDLGMGSIGHRLNLLKSVWELKREQGIALGEDDWRPTDVELEEKKISLGNIERLMELIVEQQERLLYLERNHARLLSSLEESGMRVAVQQLDALDLESKRNVPWRDFGHRQSDGKDAETGTSKALRRASQLFPSSLASTTTNHTAPLSSDSATFHDSFTPTTTSTSYPFDSPQNNASSAAKPAPNQPPPLTRLMSGSSIATTGSPSSSQASQSLSTSTRSILTGPTDASAGLAKAPNSVSPTPPHNNTTSERSKARDAANNAAKSFRVTLDDPCWKVLPAALKKYHIKDDWENYALFLCFGVTERCMSYDERPLLLFQRLKEEGSKPVFMLRHLRDIKSPLAIAQHKQAVRLGLPATSKDVILPELKPADATSTSPTKVSGLKPGRRPEDGITPAGSAFPELPSPGIKDGETGAIIAPRSATHRSLPDKDGNPVSVYYAVAIYPYVADRQDEFDVAIGACYVVLSRTKGWYIVQRDPSGVGKIVVDHSKSGWVPAGCLIELHTPIGVLSAGSCDPVYPGLGPLLPSGVTSSTNNAVVLMNWEAKGSDQFTISEGEELKVYKRYCHWSYAIRPSTGERGWVPSWFLGKQPSSSSGTGLGANSQPASAATPTGPIPQQNVLSGSSGVTIIEDREKDEE